MSDRKSTVSTADGTTGHFALHLGTKEHPRSMSEALRELQCYLDNARIKSWSYADAMWADNGRFSVHVTFPDARSAEIAQRDW